MLKRRCATLLLASVSVFCAPIRAQNLPDNPEQQILFLQNSNDGQQVAAAVGQRIEIKLTTVGPGSYKVPDISSSALRFLNVAWPRLQTPAGPTQVYLFDAVAEGIAVIRIPHSERASFSVTVQVNPRAGKTLHEQITPDQVSHGEWKGAWTNLVNDVRQTFTPSMQKLTAVEVNLAVANPGPDEEELTLQVLNASDELLATVSRTVPVSQCAHALFVFSEGGLAVTPGKVYSIRLSGQHLFGWKYVVEGYENGEALFNGRSLLPGARSTFLFRTFAAR